MIANLHLTPKEETKNPLKLSGPTPYVIDFKTGKQVWKEYELQVSAYRVALENGENPLQEKNPNGTDGPMIDLSGMRTAILQLGYDRNKAGYKFTEIDDAFELFQVAKRIWKAEIGDNQPGFTKREFPIVLSPGTEQEVTVAEAFPEAMPQQETEADMGIPELVEDIAVEEPRKKGPRKISNV